MLTIKIWGLSSLQRFKLNKIAEELIDLTLKNATVIFPDERTNHGDIFVEGRMSHDNDLTPDDIAEKIGKYLRESFSKVKNINCLITEDESITSF